MRWATSDQLRHSGATSSVASRHLPLEGKAKPRANAGLLWLPLEGKLSWPISREAMTDEVGHFGRGSSQRGPPHPSLRDTFPSRGRQTAGERRSAMASP